MNLSFEMSAEDWNELQKQFYFQQMLKYYQQHYPSNTQFQIDHSSDTLYNNLFKAFLISQDAKQELSNQLVEERIKFNILKEKFDELQKLYDNEKDRKRKTKISITIDEVIKKTKT